MYPCVQMLFMLFCASGSRMTSTPGPGTQQNGRVADAAPRRVRARRALPNGRSIVGALLVTSAAVGAFLVAGTDRSDPRTDYLVLTSDIAVGDSLTRADVVADPLDLGTTVAATAVAGTADVGGAVALRDLRAGELLVNDDVLARVDVGNDTVGPIHELTIPVPLDRSPAALFAGDRVTVLATATLADELITHVAAEDLLVLRFDTGADRIGGAAQGVLTLAVDDPGTVLSVAHSAQQGDMTVVRTTRALGDTYPVSTGSRPLDAEELTR